MAAGGRKGGNDFSLESRHLVGLFLLLVVIFGMVFTLGYMLGRSQFDSHLRAATATSADTDLAPARGLSAKQPSAKSAVPQSDLPANTATAPAWDFYHSAESGTPDHVLDAPNTDASEPAPASKPSSSVARAGSKAADSRFVPKGAIMLQVAALKSEADALALAQALQQKKIPAYVIPPGPDNYYHVQVGPYKSAQAAAAGRDVLEAQGFKTLTKR